LINNADARSIHEIIELEKFVVETKNFRILSTKLFRRVDFRRSYQNGLSVCEYNPNSKACREVKLLIEEIRKIPV